MTGKQAVIDALSLLGRNEQRGKSPDITLLQGCMTALNCIYADLFCLCYDDEFIPLFTFDDKVKLPKKVLHDCYVYGVAVMLAQADNDFEKMNRFSKLYNLKRAKCTTVKSIKNSFLSESDADV